MNTNYEDVLMRSHAILEGLTLTLLVIGGVLVVEPGALAAAEQSMLDLGARRRVAAAPNDTNYKVVEESIRWDASKTAIVVCDMWDQHWCQGATRRVAEMAPRMNETVAAAREKGVLIIHCPSSCMSHYKDTTMRKLAIQAPKIETEISLQSWCHLDSAREASLPIDDSDGGCDCWPPCASGSPWQQQIESIEIQPNDAITDSGEAYYLMKQRGIENVIVMGVHTNMCVLGRPFSIRQMVYQGQNVVLMRDMTDTMYNPRMTPFVSHVRGTNLVVEHVEKHWCPTITSTAFTGKTPFVFEEATQPHVVFVIGEREYETKETLPVFAKEHLEPAGFRCTFIHADETDGNNFPGLLTLKTADLLILSVRRRALPDKQLALVHEYLDAGKPLVGIRTACHAFHTRGQHPDGHAEWQEFDPDVLGGNYHGHHPDGPKTSLERTASAADHPILAGLSIESFAGNGSLYQVSPLDSNAAPLLLGSVPELPVEPVAWTHHYQESRVFYTSLGHPDDFQNAAFNQLLVNAVRWATEKAAKPL
jgi:nicotinamidase-related amidase/type 1 glutamine amidotransferase